MHIPKVTIKSEFQPPWFDSELFSSCRKNDRLRAKFKISGSISDKLKFDTSRKDFKRLEHQLKSEIIFSIVMIQCLLLRSFGHILSINLTAAVFLIVLVILGSFGSNQKIKLNCSTLSFSTSFRILYFMTLTSPMPMMLILILTLII